MIHQNKLIEKLKKLKAIFLVEGIHGIWWRILIRINGEKYTKNFQKQYLAWYEKNGIESLNVKSLKQRLSRLKKKPLISIITPVYNTNPIHLKECIESVRNQVYDNWELILVDDNSTNTEVWAILKNYAKHDKRIIIKKRVTNGHICVASNDAVKLARGTWIALLDHDDVLWPNALAEVVSAQNKHPQAQFFYSDEDKIEEDSTTHCDPFFKPQWSPYFLWACNYITHFAVLKKSLVDTIGGFRVDTQGAQDWDLFLRAIDEIGGFSQHPSSPHCKIIHIPKILYSWRKSPTSTASEKHSATAKAYAYDAQRKVLSDYFSTKNGAEIINSKYLGMYHVFPRVIEPTTLSVIIAVTDEAKSIKKLLKMCQSSFAERVEIVFVASKSISPTYQSFLHKYGKVIISKKRTALAHELYDEGVAVATHNVFVFLESTVIPKDKQWLDKLLAYGMIPKVGAVSPRSVYPNNRIKQNGYVLSNFSSNHNVKRYIRGFFANCRPEFSYGVGTVLLACTRPFSALAETCVLMRREVYEKYGLWKKYAYTKKSGLDLSLRINQAGLYCVVVPSVEVNSGVNADEFATTVADDNLSDYFLNHNYTIQQNILGLE